jgi:predicted phosphate transport protein (TIGR00153 family)
VGIKDWFRPRQDVFIRLLIDQAEQTKIGLEALEAYMNSHSQEDAARVGKAEKDADELRRILIDELHRTFITPIDREDIFRLSRSIDDILDYAYSTVDEMLILKLQPNEHLCRMTKLLSKAAAEIHMAMLRLQEHPKVAAEHAVRAKSVENRVETAYREAIAALFSGPVDLEHVVQMLKLREIYRHISNCADRGDEAANIIGDIVVETT